LAGVSIKLDFHSDLPIYMQIVEQIQRLVAAGTLQPGDQLPTVRTLAAELRINFNTVARAYRILDEARLISTQQGRGTYIFEQPSADAQHMLRQEALAALTAHYLEEALQLGFSPEEVLNQLEQHIKDGLSADQL
jgi:GntR family transcriptional regulator